MIPQGIEIVQKAIAADAENDYEKALGYYRDALARFTMGLKYEKNEARKKLILDRVEGYMKRAEELSDYLKKQNELDNGDSGGVAAKNKDGKEESEDAEKKKLRGALSSAIVTEKPNIKWEDVAGLDNAKESLKEVSSFHHDLSGPSHLLYRPSFYPPSFPSFSPGKGNHSRASYCMGLQEQESLI